MNLITVEQADEIILANTKDFGTELIPFQECLGRVLAEDLYCDRDLPPFNRVALDGIAIRYQDLLKGFVSFNIVGTQAAGDACIELSQAGDAVEIMTGAALPDSADTVIPYEDIKFVKGLATLLKNEFRLGQGVHKKGIDKKKGEVAVAKNQWVTPAIISVAATIGKTALLVKKVPRVLIVSTGDELVEVTEVPSPFQIRRSNNYALEAILSKYKVPAQMMHLPDDAATIERIVKECLEKYDVILLSGGISMGKYDYVPTVLEQVGVKKMFHKVRQRPGKPFWFGTFEDRVHVFALPGNPVSTFMCAMRYFVPWLCRSWEILGHSFTFAILGRDVQFEAPLQYFMQVTLTVNAQGHQVAMPIEGHGSGDLANLVDNNAFMELPLGNKVYEASGVYRVWPF